MKLPSLDLNGSYSLYDEGNPFNVDGVLHPNCICLFKNEWWHRSTDLDALVEVQRWDGLKIRPSMWRGAWSLARKLIHSNRARPAMISEAEAVLFRWRVEGRPAFIMPQGWSWQEAPEFHFPDDLPTQPQNPLQLMEARA